MGGDLACTFLRRFLFELKKDLGNLGWVFYRCESDDSSDFKQFESVENVFYIYFFKYFDCIKNITNKLN